MRSTPQRRARNSASLLNSAASLHAWICAMRPKSSSRWRTYSPIALVQAAPVACLASVLPGLAANPRLSGRPSSCHADWNRPA